VQIDNDGRDAQTYRIIGAAMEVHRQLGPGFLEAVYHEALVIEFTLKDIPFVREVELPIHYRGRALACTYRADFLCFEEVIVELKAQEKLSGTERAQVLNYLKATGLHRALLLNFGTSSLTQERLVL
jgi:GxxExxY protein